MPLLNSLLLSGLAAACLFTWAHASAASHERETIQIASSIDSDWPGDSSKPRVPHEPKSEKNSDANSEDSADPNTSKNKKHSIDPDFPDKSDQPVYQSDNTPSPDASNQNPSSVDPDWSDE